jgi:hypothetical protein
MAKVKDETRYKRFVRKAYEERGHWTGAYEPAMGSDVGYPDIQVLSPAKRLLPCELKVGEVVGGIVFPREVRGDQVVWARNFWRAGGISIMMIGVETSKDRWDTYAVTGEMMLDWRNGYDIHRTFHLKGTLGLDLETMFCHYLHETSILPLARELGCVI